MLNIKCHCHEFTTFGLRDSCPSLFIRIFGLLLYVGKILNVEQEAYNTADFFTVAVVNYETVVGHAGSLCIFHLVWPFIKHNGTVTCKVTR